MRGGYSVLHRHIITRSSARDDVAVTSRFPRFESGDQVLVVEPVT
jgi:hypothetical protein